MAEQGENGEPPQIRSAGAVVWRPSGLGTQVLLVHRPKYDDWSFAKGKLEPGEHVLLAAVREVAEETGMTVTLGPRLPAVHYLAGRARKRVDYWAATVAAAPPSFAANNEVDKIAWLAAGSARERLSYQRDVETLAAFGAGRRGGVRRTQPLILLRHGSAGDKSDWAGSDGARPLDDCGQREASVLAGLLRCFGIGRIVSAPALRCTATVQPYAAAAGLQVEVEPAFDVAGQDTPAAGLGTWKLAAEKAAAQLAATDEAVVICGHRENLPVLLDAVCAELGQPAPEPNPLRKGEFVVVHRAGGTVAAIERYHPDGAD